RAADRLAAVLATIDMCPPRVPVFSNSKAAPYPDAKLAIAELLTDHLVSPVRFAEEVEAMHDAGARVFVEVGPRRILTRLVDQILEGRPHIAVPVDGGKALLLGFLRAVAQLAAQGVPVQLDRLFEGGAGRPLGSRVAGTGLFAEVGVGDHLVGQWRMGKPCEWKQRHDRCFFCDAPRICRSARQWSVERGVLSVTPGGARNRRQ